MMVTNPFFRQFHCRWREVGKHSRPGTTDCRAGATPSVARETRTRSQATQTCEGSHMVEKEKNVSHGDILLARRETKKSRGMPTGDQQKLCKIHQRKTSRCSLPSSNLSRFCMEIARVLNQNQADRRTGTAPSVLACQAAVRIRNTNRLSKNAIRRKSSHPADQLQKKALASVGEKIVMYLKDMTGG